MLGSIEVNPLSRYIALWGTRTVRALRSRRLSRPSLVVDLFNLLFGKDMPLQSVYRPSRRFIPTAANGSFLRCLRRRLGIGAPLSRRARCDVVQGRCATGCSL